MWGTTAYEVANANPFRYRSYYYDTETGLFYVGSRYYDPEVGRWINADDTDILRLAHGQLLGANLFAYCMNDPVNSSDPTGYWSLPTPQTIIAGAVIGGLLGALIDAVIQLTFGGKNFSTLDWESIGIEFLSGALTGGLIACNLPAPATNLGRGIIGMMSSLAHSIRQGKFSSIKGAFTAIGQAILSGAVTIIIGSVRAKYGKTLNYNNVMQMIGKIGINRAIRGGIRFSFTVFGWWRFNFVLN